MKTGARNTKMTGLNNSTFSQRFVSGVALLVATLGLIPSSAQSPVPRLTERKADNPSLPQTTGYPYSVKSVAFSPNGRLLATGSVVTIKLWEVETGAEVHTLRGHTDWVWGVAFSPDGRLLASASLDHTAKIWEIETGKEIRTLHTSAQVWSVAFSPDGRLLVTGDGSPWPNPKRPKGGFAQIKGWEVATGRELFSIKGDKIGVYDVAFSPDGKWLVSAGYDMKVRLWEVATGRERRTMKGHKGIVHSVAFSPDGQFVASASADRTVRLWDVPKGRKLRTFGPTSPKASLFGGELAISPDGQWLASSGWDSPLNLWDLATGRLRSTFPGSEDMGINSVAFSPDGRWLVLGSGRDDNRIRLWNVRTGDNPLSWIHSFQWTLGIVNVQRSATPPAGYWGTAALKPGFQYCLVTIELKNLAEGRLRFEIPKYNIALRDQSGEEFRVKDVGWEGKESLPALADRGSTYSIKWGDLFTFRVVSGKYDYFIRPGKAMIFSFVFQVPETIADDQLQLRFLNAPPIPITSAAE